MDAAYRAGMNRGSADKLARRPFDDSAPPKYRTIDTDRKAYKKGYKKGYDKTSAPMVSGDATGGIIPSEADLMNQIMGRAADLEKYASDAGAYVDQVAEYYKTAMGIIATAKKIPGSSYVLDFGKIEKKVKGFASGLYQKAMDIGAPSEVLKKIEFMATPEQLAASAPPPAAAPPPPPPPPAPKQTVAPLLGGRLGLLTTLKGETQAAKDRRAQEIAAKRENEKAAAAAAAAAAAPPGSMVPMPMPGMPGMTVMNATVAAPTGTTTTADAQKKDEKPSWFSQNWYWVAGGAVLAAGGGYLYYRSSKSPVA